MSSSERVLFGIAAPQIHTQFPVDPSAIQDFVQRAEALGFHSLWAQEQAGLRARAGALEAISFLSYAAAVTRRIQLGCAVFIINLHNPILFAKGLASLDQLSEGRLIAGVGLGAVTRLYEAYGLAPERRVARFLEALTLIQKLWTEENLTFEGTYWQLKNVSLLPKPVQRPHPPIWFGAHAPVALKRAVKRGSGFMGAGSSSTEEFKKEVQIVLSALPEEKRGPGRFMIGKRVYIAVDHDRERAIKRLREWSAQYYGTADLADRVGVWGSPDECVEQLNEIVAAGARLLLLNPVFDLPDHLELFAEKLIPHIRS